MSDRERFRCEDIATADGINTLQVPSGLHYLESDGRYERRRVVLFVGVVGLVGVGLIRLVGLVVVRLAGFRAHRGIHRRAQPEGVARSEGYHVFRVRF